MASEFIAAARGVATFPAPLKALVAGVLTGLALSAPSAYATTYTVLSSNDAGPGSLRDAIAQANADSSPPAVVLIPSTVTGAITLSSGQLYIQHAMSVQGPGADQLTVSGSGISRVFQVSTGAGDDVSISGLRIADGDVPFHSNGAGIASYDANLTLSNCILDNNSAFNGSGGGIYAHGTLARTVTLSSVTVQNNHAFSGGGIEINGASLNINASIVSGNHSSGGGVYGGGGLRMRGGSYSVITSTRVEGNFAETAGGGMQIIGSELAIADSQISGNKVWDGSGGGVYIEGGAMDMRRTLIQNNYAYRDGGGVQLLRSYSISGNATILDSTISNNQSRIGYGGGIHVFNDGLSPVTFTNDTIYGNSALWGFGGGGGIHSAGGTGGAAVLTLESSTVTGNAAYAGGGIISGGNPVTLHNSIVANNMASAYVVYPDPDLQGSFTAAHNLIGDAGDAAFNTNANIIGVDPLLGSLGDNGGPTPTLLPLDGSPVIDAGDGVGVPGADQRGRPRPYGLAVDIGAVEWDDIIFRNGFEPFVAIIL